MKTKTSTRLLASAFMAAFLLLFGFDAFAQNFENNTASGVYNATCGAVIKMKCSTGAFTSDDNNDLGRDATNYIKGTVAYSSSTAGQVVQARYYYNLILENQTKTIADGVHVLNVDATACTPTGYGTSIAGYYIVPGTGDRTYEGTFYYDGTGAQTIVGESGSSGVNGYNNLNLDNGTKTIAAGTEVEVDEALTTAADAPLSILGDLVLGSEASTLDGTTTLNNTDASLTTGTGAVNFNEDLTVTLGDVIIPAGAGTVTIGTNNDFSLANSADATLSLADGTNLVITGSFSNNYTSDYSNAVFACNSTVTYNGVQNPQNIEGTSAAGYGNLILSGGAKQGDDNINICKNFSLSGGNLTMNNGTFDRILRMLDADGTVTYGGGGTGNEEVIGQFRRDIEGTFAGGTYVFNNRLTTLNITSGTYPGYVTFLVRPSVNPPQYVAGTDVNRTIQYITDASANFESTVKVGYLLAEGPDGGNWTSPYTQDKLRMYESNAAGYEKIGTGSAPDRVPAALTNLGSISIAGIDWTSTTVLPNNIDKIASTNYILLRSGPTTFYSVNSGRWTNPATWDEGTWPTADDNVEIRHLVYAGIAGPFAGTLAANNTTPESDVSRYGATNAAANEVTIASGYANASLIIGNEDNSDNYVFKFKATTGKFTNLNAIAPSDAFPNNNTKANITATGTNGLWITNIITGSKTVTFRVAAVENSGTINNESILEICE